MLLVELAYIFPIEVQISYHFQQVIQHHDKCLSAENEMSQDVFQSDYILVPFKNI